MSIKILLHPFFYEIAGGEETVEVEGKNVNECLANLVSRFPGLEKELFEKGRKLHKYIEIFINGKTTYPHELAYLVRDGDELSIILLVAGG
jgi:MoaD family protein